MNKNVKIIANLMVFPAFLCTSCNTITKSDWESYREIYEECLSDRDFHSQLYIFPESVEGLEITNFVFSNTTDLFTGSWLMYLGLKWDEAGFNKELDRLNNIKATYKSGDVKPIIKYEEKSLYLTVYKDNRFEYALYNKDSFEITYVSNQLYEWKDTPVKEEHILPNVTIPSDLDDGNNSYNIYYLYDGDVGVEVVD